jgi:hypothetical protein
MPVSEIRDHPALDLSRSKEIPAMVPGPRQPRLGPISLDLPQPLQHSLIQRLWPWILPPIRKHRRKPKGYKRRWQDLAVYWTVVVCLVCAYQRVLHGAGLFPFDGLGEVQVICNLGRARQRRDRPGIVKERLCDHLLQVSRSADRHSWQRIGHSMHRHSQLYTTFGRKGLCLDESFVDRTSIL